MKPNPYPGKLIALEGLDGAGTTSQAALLADWLRRYRRKQVPRVVVTREPSQGPAGAQIRSVLSRRLKMNPLTLAALFVADRLDHLYSDTGVAAHLEQGVWVIMDRYYLSSFAYQPLKFERDEENEWFLRLHDPCLVPDMTIFLDVPVEVCLERIALNRGFHFELFEGRETLQQVYEQYLKAIGRSRKEGHNIQMVSGEGTIRQIARTINERIKRAFFVPAALSSIEQQALWKQFPILEKIWRRAAEELGLGLLAVKRLAPDPIKNPGGGYQLALAGLTTTYYVAGYLNLPQTSLKLVVRGHEDDTRKRLENLCRNIHRSPQERLPWMNRG